MNATTLQQDVKTLPHRVIDYLIKGLPQVESPKRVVHLKERLAWTGVVLVLYYLLGQITLYGMTKEAQDYFSFFSVVFASERGTLITLGIGPVVTAGIFMQLFQGGEIFNYDLASHEGRARFQGVQKLLAVIMCLFEAILFVYAGVFGHRTFGIEVFFVLQVASGALLIVFMDEVVTKWGFGSGISLFIAAGVAKDVMWKMFSFTESSAYRGQMIGAVPSFVRSLMDGAPMWMRGDLPDILQVFSTLTVFLAVVYFERLWISVPLSMGKFTGTRGGYPLKFIYTSNIPVIMAMSVFGTCQFVARVASSVFGVTFLGEYNASGSAVGGLMYYLSPPRGLLRLMAEPYRAVIYIVILLVLCALFSWLWVNITGMDSHTVGQRIQQAGVQVAGVQRDLRTIESVLDKYIPPVTIVGGMVVGLLSACADFTNALGTGTGILLTVSIVHRMYEDLMRQPELPERLRRMLAV